MPRLSLQGFCKLIVNQRISCFHLLAQLLLIELSRKSIFLLSKILSRNFIFCYLIALLCDILSVDAHMLVFWYDKLRVRWFSE